MFQLVENNYLVKIGCCKLSKCKHICCVFHLCILFSMIMQNEEYQLKDELYKCNKLCVCKRDEKM